MFSLREMSYQNCLLNLQNLCFRWQDSVFNVLKYCNKNNLVLHVEFTINGSKMPYP